MEDEHLESSYEERYEAPEVEPGPYGEFDEYNDPDATACANGDYNTFEDEQVVHDNEGDTDFDESGESDRFDGEGDGYDENATEMD